MFSKKMGLVVKFLLLSFFACFFLISCGGGGGGGSSPATSPVAITSDNAVPVTSEIFQSGSLLSDSAQLTGQNFTGAVSTSQTKEVGIVEVIKWQMEKLRQDEDNLLSDTSSAVGVMQSGTMQCDYGGSAAITANDNDHDGTLSAGDTATITFNNCSMSSDGSLGTLNGTMSLYVNSISGDLVNSGSFDVRVTLGNMQMVLLGTTFTGTGDMLLNMNFSGSSSNFTASGSKLSYRDSNNISRTLTNYWMYSATTDSMATWTYRFRGTLTSTHVLGGSVSFQTTTDFSGLATDNNPSAGVLEVTGAIPEGANSNSNMTVTVLSSTQVRLEIDANGDGTIETQTVDWSQIMP